MTSQAPAARICHVISLLLMHSIDAVVGGMMTSREVDSRLPVYVSSVRVIVALLITLFLPFPVDRMATATTAGALARRAVIGESVTVDCLLPRFYTSRN